MRQCEECGTEFKSGNSYRVHKHRFHSEPKTESVQEVVPGKESEVTPEEPKQTIQEDPEKKDDGLGGAIAIGGAVVGLVLLLLFGGRK